MKLVEILTTLLLSLALVSSSGLVHPDEVAVSNASTQTGHHALPPSELRRLFKDTVSKNKPNQVRTLLEDHVPLSQNLDEASQQTVSNSCVSANTPSSQDKFDINEIIPNWGTLLRWAADRGHSDLIPVLLKRGADVDSKFSRLDMTPIMLAAQYGHDTVVAQLLNTLAIHLERVHSLIITQDKYGRTALHWAALYGRGTVIAQFLNLFASQPERMYSLITIQSSFGKTVLHYAASKSRDTMVEQLLNALAAQPEYIHCLITTQDSNGRTALHEAAQDGNDTVVAQLLDALATHPEHIHSLIATQDRYDYTALHYAASKGCESMVAHLLNALAAQPECMHCTIMAQDRNGMTALHWAAKCGRDAVVAQLLNALATHPERIYSLITTKSNAGSTALHLAARDGREAIVAQLLNALAIHPERMYSLITTQDNGGKTALHYAAQDGRDTVVAQLLNALTVHPECVFSLITTHDNGGKTALYYAGARINAKAIKLLLEHYKEALDKIESDTFSPEVGLLPSACSDLVNLVDQEMGWALHQSITHNFFEVIELLVRFGANLDVEDENGNTHIHRAARDGRSAMVIALITNGAESRGNNTGKTPLDVAQGLTPEALSLLEERTARTVLK